MSIVYGFMLLHMLETKLNQQVKKETSNAWVRISRLETKKGNDMAGTEE